jgi:hypothetical protein
MNKWYTAGPEVYTKAERIYINVCLYVCVYTHVKIRIQCSCHIFPLFTQFCFHFPTVPAGLYTEAERTRAEVPPAVSFKVVKYHGTRPASHPHPVYTYMYVHIHTYVCACMCICVYVCVCACMYIHTYNAYVYTYYMHTHTHWYTYINECVCVCVCI